MDIARSQSLPTLWRWALIGTFTAFAWMLLSLVLGLGSSVAHAEETDDDSLLGAVTSVVDRTASTVTQTVSTVTGSVTEAVNTAVDVAPSPVQQPVRDVVTAVGSVVTQATEPVTDIVSVGAVGAVAQPVAEAVAEVPVVGGIASGLGLDDAVTDLGRTVDHTVDGLLGAVTDTGAELGLPPTGVLPPLLPSRPSIPVGGHLLPALDEFLPTSAALAGAWGAASASAVFLAASAPISAVTAATATAPDARGPSTPAGALCPLSASSSGPGGAGSGAWALVALGPLVALRAWVRRAGPEDEHAPAAPAGSTDVSPD